jgi:hypothetical protein
MAHSTPTWRAYIGLALLAAWPTLAAGQVTVQPNPAGTPAPAWAEQQVPNPDDPRVQEYAKRQKRRVEIERDLKKLRAEYFRNIRNKDIRQAGISKLTRMEACKDPALYPSLLDIFQGEGADVEGAILDLLAEQKSGEGDTTLAWVGVFGKSKEFRAAATERLKRRIREARAAGAAAGTTDQIKSVVAMGLRRGNRDHELSAAANLADALDLVEAIPMLISAQIGTPQTQVAGSGGGGGEHSLGWILVGTQTAFVSDLTPVVGDSAVAFDPEVSVITEGTYVRVFDAVVVTYRTEVNSALIRLTSRAWGQPTDKLGWDNNKWREWYTGTFLPFQETKAKAEKAKAERAAAERTK